MRVAVALLGCVPLLGCVGSVPNAREAAISQRLDAARSGIMPPLGATVSTLDQRRLQEQPQGENRPLAGSLAQLPGVALGSSRQIIVRGQ